MFQVSLIVLISVLAATSGFLSSRLQVRSARFQNTLFSECPEKLKDAKGRCPGDAGYTPLIKEAPVDFAAYAASQKVKKEVPITKDVGCPEKLKDAKGRCPGDAGYTPLIKEAPVDFAAYAASQKAKKAAGGK